VGLVPRAGDHFTSPCTVHRTFYETPPQDHLAILRFVRHLYVDGTGPPEVQHFFKLRPLLRFARFRAPYSLCETSTTDYKTCLTPSTVRCLFLKIHSASFRLYLWATILHNDAMKSSPPYLARASFLGDILLPHTESLHDSIVTIPPTKSRIHLVRSPLCGSSSPNCFSTTVFQFFVRAHPAHLTAKCSPVAAPLPVYVTDWFLLRSISR